MLNNLKNTKKTFFTKYFPFLHYLDGDYHRYESKFFAFIWQEPGYLKQYFFTTFLLVYFGSPQLATIYMVTNAAMWLGYEDDLDDTEVFDDDMEGDWDFVWEEANYYAAILLFMGQAEAEEEYDKETHLDTVLYEYNTFDYHIFADKYLQLFNNTKNVSHFNICFFYDLCEWNDFLSNIFGDSFFNIISGQFENIFIYQNNFLQKFDSDNLFFPLKSSTKKNYLSYYKKDPDFYYNKTLESFFFTLYYKFAILRTQFGTKFVYDLILSDLNEFFFFLNKKNLYSNNLFFIYLNKFKKKVSKHNFSFDFDPSSLKFYDNSTFKSLALKNSVFNIKHWSFSKKKKIFFYWKKNFCGINFKNDHLFSKFNYKFEKLLSNPIIAKQVENMESIFTEIPEKGEPYIDFKQIKQNLAFKWKYRKYSKYRPKRQFENLIKKATNFKLKLDRNKSRYIKYREENLQSDFMKMRKKGFFWDNFYSVIDAIFMDPDHNNKQDNSNVACLGFDHLISIINRKMPTAIESIFLQNILTYKPLVKNFYLAEKADPLFFDLSKNKKFKKLIETNLEAFFKFSYKDLVLTNVCTYEQLWFSLGFYSPLIIDVISHKLFFLIKKKKKNYYCNYYYYFFY